MCVLIFLISINFTLGTAMFLAQVSLTQGLCVFILHYVYTCSEVFDTKYLIPVFDTKAKALYSPEPL